MALVHVWFSTKGRRPLLVDDLRDFVLTQFSTLALRAGTQLIEQRLNLITCTYC
jgi:hypothetical protein